MSRRKEALHPIRVDVLSLRYRFEGRRRRLQNGLKRLAARRHMAIGANQDRQFSPFQNVVCAAALLAPAWATGNEDEEGRKRCEYCPHGQHPEFGTTVTISRWPPVGLIRIKILRRSPDKKIPYETELTAEWT